MIYWDWQPICCRPFKETEEATVKLGGGLCHPNLEVGRIMGNRDWSEIIFYIVIVLAFVRLIYGIA